MRQVILSITALAFIALFNGCTNDPTPPKNCKVKEGMTSKQVEKAINWKYCKESF